MSCHPMARSHLQPEKKRRSGQQKYNSELVSKQGLLLDLPFSFVFLFGTKDWMDGPWTHLNKPILTIEMALQAADWTVQCFLHQASMLPPSYAKCPILPRKNALLPAAALYLLPSSQISLLFPECHRDQPGSDFRDWRQIVSNWKIWPEHLHFKGKGS